ncbi:hypothetical protein AGDE_13570 [Angomonas deanei]|nr:hypothetical protein AGDE_13570 [Angomonas deanei]|eukprot:EPY22072.1 hypothetical protein AGDE_13570 [Angomonas deanei]
MLEDCEILGGVFIKLNLEAAAEREGELLEELDESAAEYTDTLEKLEEFVALLDAARESEKDSRERLVKREDELLTMQQDRDRLRKEFEEAMDSQRRLSASSLVEDGEGRGGFAGSNALVQSLKDEIEQLRKERSELQATLEQNEMDQREAVDSLNSHIADLMEELEEKGGEYSVTLEKLEEFVSLLEAARAGERSALLQVESREEELMDLTAERNELHGALEDILPELEEFLARLREEVEEDSVERRAPGYEGGTTAPTSADDLSVLVRGTLTKMEEYLARVKSEKEELKKELNKRKDNSQVAHSSAERMLREIEFLRSQEREEEEEEE